MEVEGGKKGGSRDVRSGVTGMAKSMEALERAWEKEEWGVLLVTE